MRRPIGFWLLLLPFLLLSEGCAEAVVALPAPLLDEDGAAALLIAAEVARANAYAGGDPRPLRPLFSNSAIAGLRPDLAHLQQRGERIEERADTRRLVHWAAAEGGAEGVLEVAGEQRVVPAGGAPRAWSRIVRQWWAALGWIDGRWLVQRSADLPPDQWWRT